MTPYFLIRYIPYRRINLIGLPKINLRILRILAVLMIISFLGLYIYQVNAETSERYLVQEYQKKISEISKENKILEINSAQIASLDNITRLLEELDFEKTGKIHYIRALDAQVVTK